ncbi:MAG TPA: 50S ribosomal protein L6 [Candidatus Paceibacterota bacterium]|nr:50S ribosomal protein L6 [Candidatus Paceibacterota bacterium]
MSKIGKKPIACPSGVQVSLDGQMLTVKGPKGTLVKTLPPVLTVTVGEGTVSVVPVNAEPSRDDRAQWGLWRALVSNMIIGVSTGWTRTLEFQGVGYKAIPKGKDLELALGYSHPILIKAPEGITLTTEKTTITVSGIDREQVGHMAALIRSKRLPEPYKGSGIRYSDEIIKRKAGKKAATGSAAA